jgi:hypothetical protein
MEEIKNKVRELMIRNIQKVLTGEVKSIDLLFCKPNDVISYIESIGGEDLDDLESNGWQWDFWNNVKYDGLIYTMSGDGYYSDTMQFSIA